MELDISDNFLGRPFFAALGRVLSYNDRPLTKLTAREMYRPPPPPPTTSETTTTSSSSNSCCSSTAATAHAEDQEQQEEEEERHISALHATLGQYVAALELNLGIKGNICDGVQEV